MTFSTQLLPLLGVVVGGGMAFFSTGAVERARWRRQHSIRWDEQRLDAYVSYAGTVKRNSTAVAELLAGDGIVKRSGRWPKMLGWRSLARPKRLVPPHSKECSC